MFAALRPPVSTIPPCSLTRGNLSYADCERLQFGKKTKNKNIDTAFGSKAEATSERFPMAFGLQPGPMCPVSESLFFELNVKFNCNAVNPVEWIVPSRIS